jgi:type III secretion protein N (ATPase)
MARKYELDDLRSILAKYSEVELLVRIGEYKRGSDPVTDEAIDRVDGCNNFLKQGQKECNTFDETVQMLKKVVGL